MWQSVLKGSIEFTKKIYKQKRECPTLDVATWERKISIIF